jgi:UDP-N-acetylmuramate--alanine ligase
MTTSDNLVEKLHSAQRVHLVGLKGVAMTSLAAVLLDQGKTVTGTDTNFDRMHEGYFGKYKIEKILGFSPNNIHPNLDFVIYTGAHGGEGNIEVQTAKKLGIPSVSHGQALGLLMSKFRQLSVTGCHGKTTTSAMLATTLHTLGIDVSYAIGCEQLYPLGLPGHAGKSDFFVAEADEYVTDKTHDLTPRMFWQQPELLIITNIDFDHPDVYKNLDHITQVYKDFCLRQVSNGVKIINADDVNSKSLLCLQNVITYGLTKKADIYADDIHYENGNTQYNVMAFGEKSNVQLHIPGIHNVRNSLAVIAACLRLNFPLDSIASSLSSFRSTFRRFQFV